VGSDATKRVVEELGNDERLNRARVHPMAILLALRTYAAGKGLRGSGEWAPVPAVVDALDRAFYAAFANVEPTGKRYVLGLDVSGSMGWCSVAGSPMTPAEGSAAMAMVTLATEPECMPMAFATEFRPLPLTPRMRLDDALKRTRGMAFGGTDCALPMLWATKNKVKADVFVVYTDNETWFGKVHPAQALREYRDRMGIGAKLVVVAMAANPFSIADPADGGMLDVVGFDATVPQALAEFARA
jgi:60 kDa SS-A/Ro ribonucleoprotein